MMFLLSLLLLSSLIFNSVPAVVGLPAYSCRLDFFCMHLCFCWLPHCVSGPVVAFIPAVASVPAVMIAWCCCYCCCLHHCYCLHPDCGRQYCFSWRPVNSWWFPVTGLPPNAGIPGAVGRFCCSFRTCWFWQSCCYWLSCCWWCSCCCLRPCWSWHLYFS